MLATGIGLGTGPAQIGMALVTNVLPTLVFSGPILLLLAAALLFTLRLRDLPCSTT